MAPFAAWLPVRNDPATDLVLKMVGVGASGLTSGAGALAEACAARGLRVMADCQPPEAGGFVTTVRCRLSSDSLAAMGSGCDIAACLDRLTQRDIWAELQPGSVLLHETGGAAASEGAKPGVITYAVPFGDLHRRCGSRFPGKGLIAAGVLAQLLGLEPQQVRSRIRPAAGVPYFDAGVKYAATSLEKRDLHVLPVPADRRPQALVTARQALLLGLAGGPCDCGQACVERLQESPGEWMAEHGDPDGLRLPFTSASFPSAQGYRSADSEVTAWLGGSDVPDLLARQTGLPGLVLVAADMLDAIALTRLARRAARTGSTDVWVMLEDTLAARQQTVSMDALAGWMGASRPAAGEPMAAASAASTIWPPTAERDDEDGATVGYLAWGTAQGAVREALTLCRGFGLRVAAFFPKVLWPPPVDEIEAFAATVDRLVVVEPARAGAYTGFLRRRTSRPFSHVMPQPGRPLTAMDLFMREGLGA